MTRLFIRFYLGVVVILFLAWVIQWYVFSQRDGARNLQVVEDAYRGGVRLAREQLESAAPDQRAAIMKKFPKQFSYPVRIVPIVVLPEYARSRFDNGADSVLLVRDEPYVTTPLTDGTHALLFGPLPEFVEPSQIAVMTGLAILLLLSAGAIALLLRPVVKQLRLIERAASAIAAGDFSSRVDPRKVRSAGTLATAFNDMAAKTETMLRTQRELLQAVSHELRTPLSRINFGIELIRSAKNEQEREVRLCSLEKASEDLDDLVGELLRYVRLGTGEPRLDRSDVKLLPLIQGVIKSQSELFPTIQFVIGDKLRNGSLTIRAHRKTLERALGNLLANAGRFAKNRVRVNAVVEPEGLSIDVEDDGPGIPELDRDRVFEPFVQLDESKRGAGLGLAIVQRTVAQHGGSLTVSDSSLGGCCIRTRWPNYSE